ncbi:MAG: hypothetical protein JOY61_02250 [Chloroflexi bacterium]|nr:hypothetical protein [Chloroflexota bacterium]
MTRAIGRVRGLVLLAACGVVLQLGLVMLWTLSYQLSQQLTWTDLYLQQYPLIQQILQPLLNAGAAILPQVATPRAPKELGPWFAPLTVGWAVSCLVASVGYLGALWLLQRLQPSRASLLLIGAFEVLFVFTAFSAPGLLSQDIFGYLMYGQIGELHQLNPYIWPPSAFVRDDLLAWVAPIWRSLPSPYGPVWTDVNWLIAHPVHNWTIVEQVFAYKAFAVGLFAATLGMLWYLLGKLAPHGRVVALTAFAWNPLVLMETVGNGHNDALVLTFLIAGLIPLAASVPRARPRVVDPALLAAAVLLLVSGLVKYLSAVAGVFLVVGWLRLLPDWRRRALQLGIVGVVCAAVTVALFAPWLELPDSLDPILRQTGGNLYANAVPDLLSLTIADDVLSTHAPLSVARDEARTAMKALVDAIFLLYLIWEMRQVWLSAAGGRRAALMSVIRASARATLVIILVVSIWVQPWYFVLPLGLALLLGVRTLLAKISIGYTLTALAAMYVHYYLQDAVSSAIFLVYAGLPLLLAIPELLGRRDRPRLRVGLVDERRQTLVANAPTRAAVAELDLRVSDDRAISS